jgi:hypothetical protein
MTFGIQRQQTLLVTTELVIRRYANAFIFNNQSELDFGIAYDYWFFMTTECRRGVRPINDCTCLYMARQRILKKVMFGRMDGRMEGSINGRTDECV